MPAVMPAQSSRSTPCSSESKNAINPLYSGIALPSSALNAEMVA